MSLDHEKRIALQAAKARVKELLKPGCQIVGCEQPTIARSMCPKHYKRWKKHGDPTVVLKSAPPRSKPKPLRRRLLSAIRKNPDGCWIWEKSLTRHGYGQTSICSKMRLAHRVVYEEFVGPIPQGLTLDHLCRVRACVNPDHLDPCTAGVNTLRGEGPSAAAARATHCAQGHPFSGPNLYTWNGKRFCKACRSRLHFLRKARG